MGSPVSRGLRLEEVPVAGKAGCPGNSCRLARTLLPDRRGDASGICVKSQQIQRGNNLALPLHRKLRISVRARIRG
jgi:hypothetical protein